MRIRGAFDAPAAEVRAHVPAAFGPPLERVVGDAALDRLALARWIVSPDHPLTARVVANRLWMELLGESLVATPEDYGVGVANRLEIVKTVEPEARAAGEIVPDVDTLVTKLKEKGVV